MNRKEWKDLCKVDIAKAFYWYNIVKSKLRSNEFESDPRTDKDAKVIHHLRDTEEQRKYNDEHYEMFGFEIDENGNEIFNYGKYVVFWTKEHHNEYHRCSEETRKKLSESLKKAYEDPELREKCSKSHKGIRCKEETKRKISNVNKGKRYFGKDNPFYGKHHSDESKQKMSKSHKGALAGEKHPFYGKHHTKESKIKMSHSLKGKPSAFKGRHHSAESIEINRNKNIDSRNKVKMLYITYKNSGGILKWNAFQKAVKDGSLIPFDITYNEDGTVKEFVPQMEAIKQKDSEDSIEKENKKESISDYIPEIEEDDYDYMQ